MKSRDLSVVLNRCSLFRELGPEACDRITQEGRLRQVGEGQFFFHQGEDATTMYVILDGQVKLSQITDAGNQVIINYFGPGNGLGIIVALAGMAYPLSAEAVTAATALGWHRDQMKQLMIAYPQLALNGMEMIGHRFARLQDRFSEMATKRVEQRVARALLRLVRQFGRRTEAGILIDMPLSRQDLAQMTGTNLYNVSRILSRWEQEGLVQTRRMQVTLCRAHEMVVLAEDLVE